MATEIRVPTLGKSVTEATIGRWFKKAGDAVRADEPLVELETDKVTVEVPAPAAGVLEKIRVQGRRDRRCRRGARLDRRRSRRARSLRRAKAAPAKAEPAPAKAAAPKPRRRAGSRPCRLIRHAARAVRAKARRRIRASIPSTLAGSGKDGRVTKGDMLAAISSFTPAAPAPTAARAPRRRSRWRARRACAHDAAAPDDRAPAERGAEHRCDAHHVQ